VFKVLTRNERARNEGEVRLVARVGHIHVCAC
jgi:hypothetical protein